MLGDTLVLVWAVGCCPRRWRISFKSEHLSQQIIITLDSSTRPRISGREHPKFRKNQLCYQSEEGGGASVSLWAGVKMTQDPGLWEVSFISARLVPHQLLSLHNFSCLLRLDFCSLVSNINDPSHSFHVLQGTQKMQGMNYCSICFHLDSRKN